MDEYIKRFYTLIEKQQITYSELNEIISSPIVTWHRIENNVCTIETNCDDRYSLYINNECAV